jgi:hypothetical protein
MAEAKNLKTVERNEDGTIKSCQVYFNEKIYWLRTTKQQSENLGNDPLCKDLAGALTYWQKELDRQQPPDEPDWKFSRSQKRAQGVVNELIACGAKITKPTLRRKK